MNGTTFTGHYVVVGWGDLSRVVVEEILAAGFKVAVLVDSEDMITEIRSVFAHDNLFVGYGHYDSDVAYERLNLAEAAGVILLCGDDTQTLVLVLHLRELQPTVKITAYIQNSKLRRTVENAGVNYVISPNEVIGRMIASATFEPDVSALMEDLLSTSTGADDLDILEFRLREGHELVDAKVANAYRIIAERCGARLLTYSRRLGAKWQVVSDLADKGPLRSDDYLIVLANADAAAALSEYLQVQQGRRA